MCEFCTQHGEGKTWYLNAANYSVELLHDPDRRRFLGHFYRDVVGKGNRSLTLLERPLLKWLGIPRGMRAGVTERSKENHFGQVVPLAEVEKVLAMARSVVRLPCGCRWAKERKESRLCFGLSTGLPGPDDLLDLDWFGSPDVSRLEAVSREEALRHIREADRQGFVHSVWTFGTPFIGAICNCSLDYCLAMRATYGLRMPVMFRAEYVAGIDAAACSGCRACLHRCPFAAIGYDATVGWCAVDRRRCYGCGVCQAACPEAAIDLVERRGDPVARALW